MKLYATSPSPFVRKVLVMAIETGLSGRIEHVSLTTTPVAPDSELIRSNPIAKMPTLITDTGTALYDSRVICEYLDSLHDGARMFPLETTARWTVLRRQALGDGVLDAA
ncbi:MAG TPA: glutathione S-transferase, partial [Alphaproteobacteria bacterium]|nr:glutathione S-transferase [Alphaproteobacteria bacterium]